MLGEEMKKYDPEHAAERLFLAVRALSLPHHDERRSILDAFNEFSAAIPPDADLGDNGPNRIKSRIYEIMGFELSRPLEALETEGHLWVRAGQLTFEERTEFSRGILELLILAERARMPS
jgi:hypothetical protein